MQVKVYDSPVKLYQYQSLHQYFQVQCQIQFPKAKTEQLLLLII